MRPEPTAEANAYREEVKAFLAAQLPPSWEGIGSLDAPEADRFTDEWRQTLYTSGMLAPSWPTEYGGGGLTQVEQVVVAEEFAKAGVPTGGPNDAFGITMLGNTLIKLGTESQKRDYLPRILSGEQVWCQGYSEPNAGSDLGNLGTRAVLDGDEWVVNGQKIWTSAGHLANWIFVLTRTDPDTTKHKGITFMLCPMDQPGVEVRPIRMISGGSDFNEVFFTDARVPKENIVGEVNGGWMVAMSLLGFERGASAATNHIAYETEVARLIEVAQANGKANDPVIRQRLAAAHTKVTIMKLNGMRVLTRFLTGDLPGPDAAISKLYWSEYHREVTELALDVLGAEAMAPRGKPAWSVFRPDPIGSDAFNTQAWVESFFNARAGTIYAGTSEVQRNIMGEMVLGLPKEPRSDAGTWAETKS